MKYREKLGYIALGGFLMLVGMLAAGLTSPIGAFNNAPDAVFGTITCDEVRVRGAVIVYGKDGGIVKIGVDEDGAAVVLVHGKDGGRAIMKVGEDGESVAVLGKDGKSSASMWTSEEYGGIVGETDKNGVTTLLNPVR